MVNEWQIIKCAGYFGFAWLYIIFSSAYLAIFLSGLLIFLQDDAISVEDMDKVMKDGLGMRYAFIGPLETCHLNADGKLACIIRSHERGSSDTRHWAIFSIRH